MFYFVFLLPFILLSILSVDNRINNGFKLLIPLVIFLVFLFAGLQHGIGDYVSYEYLYNHYSFENFNVPFYKNFDGGGTGHEFIYLTLSTFFYTVGLPFSVFFIVMSFFTVGLKLFWLKKYSSYFFVSLLIYFALILIKDMTQIRGQVATSIIFLAMYFVVNNKPIKYMLMILLASGFHIFAMSALPLYLLYNTKYLKKVIIITLVSSFLISWSGGLVSLLVENLSPNFLGPVYWKLSRLYESKLTQSVNPFGFGILFLMALVIYGLIKWDEIKKNNMIRIIFIYYLYGIVGYMFFSDLGLLSFRFIEMYSHLSLAILFPFYIKISKYKMKLFMYFIAIVYSIYFLIHKINATQEYNNILFS